MSRDAYLSLGSNLGPRWENLQQVVRRLSLLDVALSQGSSVYESAPVGPVGDQPPFLNAVLRVSSRLSAKELLQVGHRIEDEMGRRRDVDKGPRCIDIDLLLVGDELHECDGLTVPHPGLTKRAFVLVPLLEISPELRDPRDGRPLSRHLERVLACQQLERFGSAGLLEQTVE